MIYLYLKKHNKTNKKYLGKTVQNPHKYLGSGTYWKEHLRRYGEDVSTEILFQTESNEELKEKAIYYSELWDVANNAEFANTVPEAGDGGDTSKSPAYQKYLNEIQRNPNSDVNKKNRERMKKNNPMHRPETVERVFSEQNNRKRAMAKVGKELSWDHKRSISEAIKAKNLKPWLGRKHSEETKLKMRGRKHSEESKLKMGEAKRIKRELRLQGNNAPI